MSIHSSSGVDVVIVAYNSREVIRGAVTPLLDTGLHVVVVDNASPDDSLAALEGLPVQTIRMSSNQGFAAGCNRGWRAGRAPYVLFLNPDARVEATSVRTLVDVLEQDERVGIVAPLIRNTAGTLDFSLRRFPRLRSTFAQALFLHRFFPVASWSDELVRDVASYDAPASVDWASGACMLVRRSLLEQLGGWDERFFMYCEDTDLCKRAHDAGFAVRFDPRAVVVHTGGASESRPRLFPTMVESRIRYAEKHHGRGVELLERLGIGLRALTHILVAKGGVKTRAGHARSLRVVAGKSAPRP